MFVYFLDALFNMVSLKNVLPQGLVFAVLHFLLYMIGMSQTRASENRPVAELNKFLFADGTLIETSANSEVVLRKQLCQLEI